MVCGSAAHGDGSVGPLHPRTILGCKGVSQRQLHLHCEIKPLCFILLFNNPQTLSRTFGPVLGNNCKHQIKRNQQVSSSGIINVGITESTEYSSGEFRVVWLLRIII